MRVRGHGRQITRTRVRGRTTSWLPGCNCGWQAEHRVGSRLEAIAKTDDHKAEAFAAQNNIVRREYPTMETE